MLLCICGESMANMWQFEHLCSDIISVETLSIDLVSII